jgi:hypothetical protein
LTLTSQASDSKTFVSYRLSQPFMQLMLFEEKAFLYGKSSGALSAPTITLTARAKAAGETALPASAIYVYASADAGLFGEGVASTVQTVTPSAGQVVDVTISSVITGAVGYNI